MELEILGSGGSFTTPKIFCECQSCIEARKNGVKYSRFGPSVFVHGPNILIDTPEEISIQINRSSIRNISACFYSHWHPDHTAGKRIFGAGEDLINEPPQNTCIPVVLTEKIAKTFSECMSIMDHFDFMEQQGVITKRVIGNDEIIELNGYKIEPIQLAQDFVFGYKIFNDSQAIIVIMDELKDWIPPIKIQETKFDLVYLPFGIFNFNPITKTKILPDDYFRYDEEATIDETLEIVKRLKSKQFVLSHIEEPDNITLELAGYLERFYSDETGQKIKIAFDTQKISL